MSRRYDEFRNVLRELFQLDQADLDFGIYRIMAVKRTEIERFLEQDLLPQVQASLAKFQPAAKADLEATLATMVVNLQTAGVDPESVPKVTELREQIAKAADLDALEDEIFSNLVTFFRRYYKEGDFISQRRYKEDAYAIPYNGEEVKLYWANHDQYYIKSADYLTSYAFRTGPDSGTGSTGPRVRFELVSAETERDNNKAQPDKERRFLLHAAAPVAVTMEGEGDGADETLVIRFEYRPDGDKRKQEKINEDTEAAVLHAAPATWQARLAAKAPTEANPQRTLLAKHLDGFTKRNTFDFFIHKDLGKFLRRELDFFIKNEIVHLDDLVDVNDAVVKQQLSKAIVLREIAHKLIDFLAQVENFQKKLWLKKKFVVETHYCITLDRVPRELYAEIAANDAQRAEWVRLFAIDEIEASTLGPGYSDPLTEGFLAANLKLVLETRLFDGDFSERLLEALANIDAQLNGLMIHSENFQGLNMFQERYREKIECIHIDPPYNTTTSGFLYRNNFRHSSWLSMMHDRIAVGHMFLAEVGVLACHIDEYEMEHLHILLDQQLRLENAGTLVWDKGMPIAGANGLATQHEYVLFSTNGPAPIRVKKKNMGVIHEKIRYLLDSYGSLSRETIAAYRSWLRDQEDFSKSEKTYDQFDESGRAFRSDNMSATDRRSNAKFYIPLIHPTTNQNCPVPEYGWRYTPETLSRLQQDNLILFGNDHETLPRKKTFMENTSDSQMSTIFRSGARGKTVLDELNLEFPFAHSIDFYSHIVGASAGETDSILDFFAGSGTTGHAVINLNREDGGDRKYILVEMGEYFDTVLKPRILKVVYSPEWKDGKPMVRDQGISQMIKVLRLESYEDTLDNLEFTRPQPQQDLFDNANRNDPFREAYLLHYMLELESRESPSLLNIQAFANPFDYRLKVTRNYEQQSVAVDLVETFNYLIGLRVQTISARQHLTAEFVRDAQGRLIVKSTRQCTAGEGWTFRQVEGQTPQGQKTLIIWRTLSGDPEKDNALLDHYFERMAFSTRDREFDVIYVNGDNNLENLRGDDEIWKVRLIEADFHRLMFDVQDV